MILYFGNILSSSGNNPSFIELLAPKLNEIYTVISASSKVNKLSRLVDMIIVFFKHRRKTRVILIDTYSYQGFYYAFVISLLSRISSIPYIPIIRGGDFIKRIERSPFLTRFFLNGAEVIISPSEYLYSELSNYFAKVVFIPNFIQMSDYEFKTRSLVQLQILWVRSFHKIYNPEQAIDVIEILRSKYEKIHLFMVGPDKDGMLEQCKVKVKRQKLEPFVTFTGKLSKEEIRRLACDCDFFINTTFIDNHPVSVIEGMALGLVVISTDVGGIPFLIEHGKEGLLVPPARADLMALAIEKAIGDRNLVTTLQQNARMKVERYDWRYVKESWLNLLNPFLK